MANLNYQWISGTSPRNIMQQNMDMFHLLPGSLDAKDGFIHLLGKTEALYPMNGSMTYSIAAPYQFFYLYEGELSVSLNDTTYTLSAGKAALLPADGVTTLQIIKTRCRYFHMYLSGLSLEHYGHILDKPFAYDAGSSSITSLNVFLERINTLQIPKVIDFAFLCKTSMWITDLLTEMAVFLLDPKAKKDAIPEYLSEIHDMFEHHYNENYTLDDLEETYSVSKYRICREFSRYYNESPIQFLNRTRIENAKTLLLTTQSSVHEVGNMVGIPNTNHFINLFKRETGATPLAFKQDAPVSISELHYL